MMMIKHLCLFLIVYTCAAIVVVNCKSMEVQIKNELPVPPDDSVLRVHCGPAYIDPGIPAKIHLHKETSFRYPHHMVIQCRYNWNKQRREFIVSGDDQKSGPCPAESKELCKWEVRGDGFYFYTAQFSWKKIHSWGKKMI